MVFLDSPSTACRLSCRHREAWRRSLGPPGVQPGALLHWAAEEPETTQAPVPSLCSLHVCHSVIMQEAAKAGSPHRPYLESEGAAAAVKMGPGTARLPSHHPASGLRAATSCRGPQGACGHPHLRVVGYFSHRERGGNR